MFREIWVHDPAYPTQRDPHPTWCPCGEIVDYQLSLQRHYDRHPGTVGSLSHYITRSCEKDTLHYLWTYRDEPEAIAAILISGSLFSRLGSTRGRYSENWPSRYGVKALASLALSQWDQVRFPWHYSCTEVLPESNSDFYYKIEDISALVRFLAEEHVLNFINYSCVFINFKAERAMSLT